MEDITEIKQKKYKGKLTHGCLALEGGAFRSSVMNAVVSSYEKTLSLRGEKK